jgi:hypothetical protein
MAIANDIAELADRTKVNLDQLFDFRVHTQLVWGVFKRWAREGNTLKSRTGATGTVMDQKDLLRRYELYKLEYLLGLPFQHIVTLFEAFLFDLLRLVLVDDPRRLRRLGKKIDVSDVVRIADHQTLVVFIVDRELNELKYDKLSEWFNYLKSLVRITSPTDDQVEQLAELKAARDLLIHNSGIVNATYLEKAGKRARYKLGEKIEISPDYFREGWSLARTVVDDVTGEAIRRFNKFPAE